MSSHNNFLREDFITRKVIETMNAYIYGAVMRTLAMSAIFSFIVIISLMALRNVTESRKVNVEFPLR